MAYKRCIVTILPYSLYYNVQVEELRDGKWVQVGLTYSLHENRLEAVISREMRGPSMFEYDATGENVPCAGEDA